MQTTTFLLHVPCSTCGAAVGEPCEVIASRPIAHRGTYRHAGLVARTPHQARKDADDEFVTVVRMDERS